MPTQVVMPQMGESVAEGTIVRWLKQPGDVVERDEPLFEISTDKVDAEIPSPAAGVLTEVRVKEGETVPVNSIVATIGEPGEAGITAPAAALPADARPSPPTQAVPSAAAAPRPAPVPQPAPPMPPVSAPAGGATTAVRPPAPEQTDAEARQRLSPVVRKIAREYRVDVSQIKGTGAGGRVTKTDILNHLAAGAPIQPAAARETDRSDKPRVAVDDRVERVPMSVMRQRIAEHMLSSRRTSAHVHSVFEVDFSRVAEIREARKAEYERLGAKLTYMAFITKAAASALQAVPIVNASVEGTDILYRKAINIGVAVALDWGLIVPVVREADRKSLFQLSKTIAELAERARSKRLSPDEVQGGTFTITNPGVFGALFGMPIINQPQVAILGVGAIEQRPVVVDNAIGIRPRAYLVLGYDHRLIDGAVADEFMSHLKKTIENFDPKDA